MDHYHLLVASMGGLHGRALAAILVYSALKRSPASYRWHTGSSNTVRSTASSLVCPSVQQRKQLLD